MGFTETDYYRGVNRLTTPQDFQCHIRSGNYPSITLTQFEKLGPTLPAAGDALLQGFISAARGTYHLFYAIIIGLPSDYLTFKTHVFLTEWKKMRFDFNDAYTHALTAWTPLEGTFLQQQELFKHEFSKTPFEAPCDKEKLPLPKKGPPLPPPMLPGKNIPPPPPPPPPLTPIGKKPSPPHKTPKKPFVPPKAAPLGSTPTPIPPSTSSNDTKDLRGQDLMAAMKKKLEREGVARLGGAPQKTTSIPPSTSGAPAVKSGVGKKDTLEPKKMKDLDKRFGDVAALFGKKT